MFIVQQILCSEQLYYLNQGRDYLDYTVSSWDSIINWYFSPKSSIFFLVNESFISVIITIKCTLSIF